MTLQELEEKLIEVGADFETISLSTEYVDERLGVGYLAGQWQVFYNERGKQNTVKKFDCESDAYEYFLHEVKRIPSYRLKDGGENRGV